jgi:hypothetical protein
MSSRGMISARQRDNSYCPDGRIAQSVLDATIVDETITQSVQRCIAQQPFIKGCAVVTRHFYLVASKFTFRYYVVVVHQGKWGCSSKDERVAAQCIARAQAYRQELLARRMAMAV